MCTTLSFPITVKKGPEERTRLFWSYKAIVKEKKIANEIHPRFQTFLRGISCNILFIHDTFPGLVIIVLDCNWKVDWESMDTRPITTGTCIQKKQRSMRWSDHVPRFLKNFRDEPDILCCFIHLLLSVKFKKNNRLERTKRRLSKYYVIIVNVWKRKKMAEQNKTLKNEHDLSVCCVTVSDLICLTQPLAISSQNFRSAEHMF